MKKIISKKAMLRVSLVTMPLVLFLSFSVFCSFKAQKMTDDFLKQLGLTKTDADSKISSSLLWGGVDVYGIKNAKNILLGNRKAVILDALTYSKNYANSAAFIKKYEEMKQQYKPKENIADTPEENRAKAIASAKDALKQTEEALKKAPAQYKNLYEEAVANARKNLKDQEDPMNKYQQMYTKNYPTLVKSFKESYQRSMADWEKKYPANHLQYIKTRLLEFMDATKDIDFTAELTTRNGKKYFVKPEYEHKGNYWKMAFRAGKEVIEPAREFVQKWINEIQ